MAPAAVPSAPINPGIRCRFHPFSPQKPLCFLTTKKFLSSPLFLLSGHRPRRFCALKASPSSLNGFALPQNLGAKTGHFDGELREAGLREKLWSRLVLLRSFLPGGSWWNLEQQEEARDGEVTKDRKEGVSVIGALRRMWMLVAKDRWVIFAAFTALMIAALSEISIPHFLAASIFSAQSGESMIFYRNARLLVMLCLASGICSGLRSCCFGIANMILVRRMREELYASLLFQDISFFDEETVGDLTSRLGADCQQVSRVIGSDLNLIARNVVQGTGALIYLFILSWPLALSTLLICSALATIMLIHGQYQKKAAKLSQELTACANEVAQETFSLMRTVRVYGMEKHEIGRYIKWLGFLSDVNLRQSMAFGAWSSSFNFLYHSTQCL